MTAAIYRAADRLIVVKFCPKRLLQRLVSPAYLDQTPRGVLRDNLEASSVTEFQHRSDVVRMIGFPPRAQRQSIARCRSFARLGRLWFQVEADRDRLIFGDAADRAHVVGAACPLPGSSTRLLVMGISRCGYETLVERDCSRGMDPAQRVE